MKFSSAREYYDTSSGIHYLEKIRVPMLFLSAANDPIAPAGNMPFDVFSGAKHAAGSRRALPIVLAVTEEGAHSMLWHQGNGDDPWACKAIAEFLSEKLLKKNNVNERSSS